MCEVGEGGGGEGVCLVSFYLSVPCSPSSSVAVVFLAVRLILALAVLDCFLVPFP